MDEHPGTCSEGFGCGCPPQRSEPSEQDPGLGSFRHQDVVLAAVLLVAGLLLIVGIVLWPLS
jgi:hypothetical protein